MSASELCTINDGLDSLESLNVAIIASLCELRREVVEASFSSLTFLSHEVVKIFEVKGLSLRAFNVLDRKIFASLSLSPNSQASLIEAFEEINNEASKHSVRFDFEIIDIDDPNQVAANADLREVKTSLSTLLPRAHRFSKLELMEAMSHFKFDIHCQPLVDLTSTKAKGVEFLIRWNHPEKGMLYPDMFLPEIERFGLETDLDLFILRSAESSLVLWSNQEVFKDLSISVNLYCCSLVTGRLMNWLESFRERYPNLVSKLILEITETGHIEDGGIAHANMHSIQRMGYSVSLDDFGAGTSICRYLTYLNPNEIKIDRSLINTAFDPKNSKANVALKMLSSMVGWIQEMKDVALVVEGIESSEQHEYLKALGVTVGQGYVYSRPVPVEIFMESCKG